MLVTDTSINIEKVESDIGFFNSCFSEVLEAMGELPLIRALDEEARVTDASVVKLYTTYFQLLNLVEENVAAQHRRRLETKQGLDKISGL